MHCLTPVVLLIFNRPQVTAAMFEAVAAARPTMLLIVADGPRHEQEAELCEQARTVVQHVDWDCEVFTNFSNVNLGCQSRVASGLDWVFSVVDEAIILEDDCVASPSFFRFCETLLDYYRDDTRVMHISGDNFQEGHQRTTYGYYFSAYPHCWGWATWKRAWKHYDANMTTWAEWKRVVCGQVDDPREQAYWMAVFDSVFNGNINSWAYRWHYACWSQNGLSVLPTANLVSNIGFGPEATHTHSASPVAALPACEIDLVGHPPVMVRHREADAFTFRHVFSPPIDSPNHQEARTLRRRLAGVKRQLFR